MKREQYKTPKTETAVLETHGLIATSMNSTGTGIRFGGNASDCPDIIEADANRQNGWDLW